MLVPAKHFLQEESVNYRAHLFTEGMAFDLVTQVLPLKHEVLSLAYPDRHHHNDHHPLKVDCRGEGRTEFISMVCSGIHLACSAAFRELHNIPVHSFPAIFLLDVHKRSPCSPVSSQIGFMKFSYNPAFLLVVLPASCILSRAASLLRRTYGPSFPSSGCYLQNLDLCCNHVASIRSVKFLVRIHSPGIPVSRKPSECVPKQSSLPEYLLHPIPPLQLQTRLLIACLPLRYPSSKCVVYLVE